MLPSPDHQISSASRLCFFAHYHPHGIAADHVLIYLRALADAGFSVVVLSTATMAEPEQAKLRAACTLLIFRENVGLDFGGWTEAVRRFFPIQAELLLLANDSVYAPVGNLPEFIDRLTAVPADFYGVVESLELAPHLQSWFLLFRPAAFCSSTFGDLMTSHITPVMSKQEIIQRFEVGLTGALVAAGLKFHAAYRPSVNGLIAPRRAFNAGHLLWRKLIERGRIPFLKIELLRDNPARVVDVDDWAEVVGAHNPALQQAIDRDLALRGQSSGVGARREWNDTLDEPNPALWPELQPFLRRDFSLRRKTLMQRLNFKLYRRAARSAGRRREQAGAFAGKERHPAW